MLVGTDGHPERKPMQVVVEPGVVRELQYVVDLHRRYGADNPYDSMEGLVAYVLAAVADGSRRPEAWERSLLEAMGLVAYCGEHHQDRDTFGAPCDRERADPGAKPGAVPSGGLIGADCPDEATVINDAIELLFRAVSALNAVLAVFDTSEHRNADRRPRESAALRAVYLALDLPWPGSGATGPG